MVEPKLRPSPVAAWTMAPVIPPKDAPTASENTSSSPKSGPLKKIPNRSANSAPMSIPSPAQLRAARPTVMRPVTCSTDRRPVPMMALRSTAKP